MRLFEGQKVFPHFLPGSHFKLLSGETLYLESDVDTELEE